MFWIFNVLEISLKTLIMQIKLEKLKFVAHNLAKFISKHGLVKVQN